MLGVEFSEETIQKLFGHEAAEDERPERLREYYFKSSTYDQVVTNLPLRILVGHKGIGKSALFQVAIDEDRKAHRLTLVVQPDDIIDLGEDTHDFLRAIRSWKNGLLGLLARKAMTGLGGDSSGFGDRIKGYSGKLLDFLSSTIKDPAYVSLDPTKRLIAEHFLANHEMCVYIDDLDRGWQGRRVDITRISALLNAIRDIANENRGVRFRVALRSDVYFLVRTSDESTDKTEGSVIWQSWTPHEIFALLVKRIETFLGRSSDLDGLLNRSQSALAARLDDVFEPRFSGKGHWANAPTYRILLSLIRKRPRDLVKLCSLAARNARIGGSGIIRTRNLESIFEEYSQGRMQDTVNEFRSELPDIERLLFGMRPSKKERVARLGYTYSTASLLQKIKNIQEQGQFRFAGNRLADERDLATFLFKINFITARKDMGDLIDRRYFEESRYLQSRFVDFGYDWEVHPAYRWALQPEDIESIFASLKLTSDGSR